MRGDEYKSSTVHLIKEIRLYQQRAAYAHSEMMVAIWVACNSLSELSKILHKIDAVLASSLARVCGP
jgi:hypothetical protein